MLIKITKSYRSCKAIFLNTQAMFDYGGGFSSMFFIPQKVESALLLELDIHLFIDYRKDAGHYIEHFLLQPCSMSTLHRANCEILCRQVKTLHQLVNMSDRDACILMLVIRQRYLLQLHCLRTVRDITLPYNKISMEIICFQQLVNNFL